MQKQNIRVHRSLTLGALLRCVFLLAAFCFACARHGAVRVHAVSSDALWPDYGDEEKLTDGTLAISCGHAEDGYVLAESLAASATKLKLRVGMGEETLTYDLDPSGGKEVLPLQFGSGTYEFSLYENAGGDRYAAKGRVVLEAQLGNEEAAFLMPNQFVSYTPESPCVARSDELAAASAEEEIYNEVCAIFEEEFAYDFVRAYMISPGDLPEVDICYENRCGICQDLAAVFVSMLRVQGIPAKLVIGYADGTYHAWTLSTVDGKEHFFDPTEAVDALSAKEYIPERYY